MKSSVISSFLPSWNPHHHHHHIPSSNTKQESFPETTVTVSTKPMSTGEPASKVIVGSPNMPKDKIGSVNRHSQQTRKSMPILLRLDSAGEDYKETAAGIKAKKALPHGVLSNSFDSYCSYNTGMNFSPMTSYEIKPNTTRNHIPDRAHASFTKSMSLPSQLNGHLPPASPMSAINLNNQFVCPVANKFPPYSLNHHFMGSAEIFGVQLPDSKQCDIAIPSYSCSNFVNKNNTMHTDGLKIKSQPSPVMSYSLEESKCGNCGSAAMEKGESETKISKWDDKVSTAPIPIVVDDGINDTLDTSMDGVSVLCKDSLATPQKKKKRRSQRKRKGKGRQNGNLSLCIHSPSQSPVSDSSRTTVSAPLYSSSPFQNASPVTNTSALNCNNSSLIPDSDLKMVSPAISVRSQTCGSKGTPISSSPLISFSACGSVFCYADSDVSVEHHSDHDEDDDFIFGDSDSVFFIEENSQGEKNTDTLSPKNLEVAQQKCQGVDSSPKGCASSSSCNGSISWDTSDNESEIDVKNSPASGIHFRFVSLTMSEEDEDNDSSSDWDLSTSPSTNEPFLFDSDEFNCGLFIENLIGQAPAVPSTSLSCSDLKNKKEVLHRLRQVNDEWNKFYASAPGHDSVDGDVSSRQSSGGQKKGVHFVSDDKLQTVHLVGDEDRGADWHHVYSQRVSFEKHVADLGKIISPVLTAEHRTKVFERLSAV